MTLPNPGSVLATLTQLTQVNPTHALLGRVKDLYHVRAIKHNTPAL